MSQSKTEIVRSNLPTKASDYNLANFGANTGANTGANIGANTGHIDGNNPDRRGDSRFVNSVENAFIVLETIRRAEHGLTLTRLREITGFELSMVQRHTYTLVALGYLIKDGQNGQLYRLAPRFLDLSFAALRQDDVVRIAAIHLDEFSENTPYSAWFSFLSDSELLYVLRSRGESYMKSLFAGRHAPLYSTAGGRAILSKMSDDSARKILQQSELTSFTPYTITDVEQIMHLVAAARKDGFASASQETRIGEVVAASAVIDGAGNPIGAIHVSTNVSSLKDQDIKTSIAPVAMNIANLISRDIKNFWT